MKYKKLLWLFILTMLFTQISQANPALDDLHRILNKKQRVTITVNKTANQATLHKIREDYYFIFIYKGACPHCHKFAPTLKDFATTFGFEIQAFSLDHKPLKEFQGTPLTPELFQTLFIGGGYKPAVPALFMVNRYTLETYAVLFGEARAYELASRVHELIGHIEEKFDA